MRVLVTGATGFVGSHVVAALAKRGHQCVAFGRRSFPPADRVEPFRGDILEGNRLLEAAEGCEAVVHLVGIIREYPKTGITFQRLHVEATERVVEVCKELGISLLLHMSALGASPSSSARYHQTKYAAEEVVRNSGLRYAIFRPSLVVGPGSRFLRDMKRLLSLRVVGVIAREFRLQPVAVRDVAMAFAEALGAPAFWGESWDLCGPEVFSLRELLQTMARVWGMKVLFLPLPLAPVRVLASLLDDLSWFPITREQLTMLEEGSICSGKGVFSLLNRQPTPIEEELSLF